MNSTSDFEKKFVVYDFSNLDLQDNSKGNCYGTCDSCDENTGGCNCDCDSGDCDCNEY